MVMVEIILDNLKVRNFSWQKRDVLTFYLPNCILYVGYLILESVCNFVCFQIFLSRTSERHYYCQIWMRNGRRWT